MMGTSGTTIRTRYIVVLSARLSHTSLLSLVTFGTCGRHVVLPTLCKCRHSYGELVVEQRVYNYLCSEHVCDRIGIQITVSNWDS